MIAYNPRVFYPWVYRNPLIGQYNIGYSNSVLNTTQGLFILGFIIGLKREEFTRKTPIYIYSK